MAEPSLIAETLPAYLRTLSANLERAQRRNVPDKDLERGLISPAEIKLLEAFTRIGLNPVQQHPIAQYDADFYFPDVKLVVEVDGASHRDRAHKDRERDRALWRKGIRTLRISNLHVATDADACARAVRDAIDRIQIDSLEAS